MFKKIWQLIVDTFRIWDQTNAARMSAAMTFYTILSLAPLLMIAVAIAGYLYEGPQVQAEIIEEVRRLTDPATAKIVKGLLANATAPTSGIVASSISIVISIFAASGVFSQLYDTFNDIWHVPNERRQGWWFSIQKRMIGIGVVVIVGALLLATLVLSSTIAYLNTLVTESYPQLVWALNLADNGLVYLLMPVVFTAVFWFFPAASVSIRDVWPAGVLTALLVSASRYLVAYYLQFSTTSEVYGAAGSLVVLLIWIYIIGLCVFFGAAFSYSWAHHFGSRQGQPMGKFGAWASSNEEQLHETSPESDEEVVEDKKSNAEEAASATPVAQSDISNRDDVVKSKTENDIGEATVADSGEVKTDPTSDPPEPPKPPIAVRRR